MSGATGPSSAPQSPAIAANFTEFERERRKLKRALQQALSDKDAADARVVAISEERDKVVAERDAAIKARDDWMARASGFSAFAVSGAAVLTANMEYSMQVVLPGLVAAALNLRDTWRVTLVIAAFVLLSMGNAGFNVLSRRYDQLYHAEMMRELSNSNAHRALCATTDGRGMLTVSVGNVPFKVLCERAADACNCASTSDFDCRGIPLAQFDVDKDGTLSIGEANKALATTLPQHVEQAGWVHRCSMPASSVSSSSACFERAGDDALLQPGEEYHKWLQCVFETRRLSQICRKQICHAKDEL